MPSSDNMHDRHDPAKNVESSDGSDLLDASALKALASGRRVNNTCLVVWLASAVFKILETPLAIPLIIVVVFASVVAVSRMASKLGFSKVRQLLLSIAMFLPLLNLLLMAWLGSRAAQALRRAGYRVGMFIATPRSAALDRQSQRSA